jgi:hypothetical protein
MTPGLGIFLIVVGAIIRYAVNVDIAGIEEGTLGLILIIAGVATLLLWLIWLLSTRNRAPAVVEEPVDPRYRRY